MVHKLRPIDASRNNPGFQIKSLSDSFLLTPKDKQSPPYTKLIIMDFLCTDTNDQALNGATPIPLSIEEAQLITRDIGYDLKGIPLSVLYLKPDAVTNNKSAMCIVGPKQATYILLCTKWDQDGKHTGVDRKYASQQRGVTKFNKHTTPGSRDGQDFWRIKINGVLSPYAIEQLHRSWANRIKEAFDDHLAHHPNDSQFIESCRKRLELDQDDNSTADNNRTEIAS